MLITRKDVGFHSRKSILKNDGELWVKKEGGSLGVTTGVYDGAKVSELIDIYMLYLI